MNKDLNDYYLRTYRPDITDSGFKRDERRKVNKLVEKFTSDKFKYFPFESLSISEKGKLVNFILNGTSERQIVANIQKDSVDRKFKEFIVEDDTDEMIKLALKIQNPLFEDINFGLFKINNRELIRFGQFTDFEVLQELKNRNRQIKSYMDEDNSLLFLMGLKNTSVKYIDDYIDYMLDSVLQFYIYRLQKNQSEEVIKKINEKLLYELSNLGEILERKIDEKKEKKLYLVNANILTRYFVAYRERLSQYNEEIAVMRVLINEVEKCPALFSKVPEEFRTSKVLSDEKQILECETIVTEGIYVDDFNVKLKETREIIDVMSKYGGRICDVNCLQDIKVYFREIFMSKVCYKKNQTLSIIRDYLDDIKVNGVQQFEREAHYIFFREKINRGYFREMNLTDCYKGKINIQKELYDLIVKVYLLYDLPESIDYIFTINNHLLKFFEGIILSQENFKN